MPEKPRVFISYARSDGEIFATDLRKRLEAENLTLWQDRARMEGGVGWWQQITEALETVEFMVLVATPNAMKSPIVTKEWRYARQQGVCIYPVQVPGLPIDFAALPRWMSDSHFHDLTKEWETFVNYLKYPCHAVRVPFMAPDLPEHFVRRDKEFGQLIGLLLDADRQNPVAITTALKGAGGFGKTTLATALCHDEDVQTAFDDGILWVTLGENPNLVDALTKLYAALTGERPGFVDVEDAAKNLADKLADKDCLLVIDDVWNIAHLRPFLRGGERCARLVTTRSLEVAVHAEAKPIHVDEMTTPEAAQMLKTGITPPPSDTAPFHKLAQRLGEWPLLLEIANGMLRKRLASDNTLDNALAWVNRALDKRGVDGITRDDAEKRRQSAAGTLDASMELLSPEERTRYTELAIFPEDTDIPLTAIGALWELDEFDTEDLISRLNDLSLLKFDPERGTIRLHDVVRQCHAARLENASYLHARLIDAWATPTTCPTPTLGAGTAITLSTPVVPTNCGNC